jgi:hypothetical protein
VQLEEILALVRVAEPLPDGLQSGLSLLYKLRNLEAHRGGIVDQRFKRLCRIVECAVGTPLPVSPRTYGTSGIIVLRYLAEIKRRLYESFDVTPPGINPDLIDADIDLAGAMNHRVNQVPVGQCEGRPGLICYC